MDETGSGTPPGIDPKREPTESHRPAAQGRFDPNAALETARKQAAEAREVAQQQEAAAHAQREADIAAYTELRKKIHGKRTELQDQTDHDAEVLKAKAEQYEQLRTIDAEHSPELKAALDDIEVGDKLHEVREYLVMLEDKLSELTTNRETIVAEIGEEALEKVITESREAKHSALQEIADLQKSFNEHEERLRRLAAPIQAALTSEPATSPAGVEHYRQLLEQLGKEIQSHEELLGKAEPMLRELTDLEAQLAELLERPAVAEHHDLEALSEQLTEMRRTFGDEIVTTTETARGREQVSSVRKHEGETVATTLTELDRDLRRQIGEQAFDALAQRYFEQRGAATPAEQQRILKDLQDGLRYGLVNRSGLLSDSRFKTELRGEAHPPYRTEDETGNEYAESRRQMAELATDVLFLKDLLSGEPTIEAEQAYMQEARILFPETAYGMTPASNEARNRHVYDRLRRHLPTLQRILTAAALQEDIQRATEITPQWDTTEQMARDELLGSWVRSAQQWLQGKRGYTASYETGTRRRPSDFEAYGSMQPWIPYPTATRLNTGSGDTRLTAELENVDTTMRSEFGPQLEQAASMRAETAHQALGEAQAKLEELRTNAATKESESKPLLERLSALEAFREVKRAEHRSSLFQALRTLQQLREQAQRALTNGGVLGYFTEGPRQAAFDKAEKEYQAEYRNLFGPFAKLTGSSLSAAPESLARLDGVWERANKAVEDQFALQKEKAKEPADKLKQANASVAAYESGQPALRTANPWTRYKSSPQP